LKPRMSVAFELVWIKYHVVESNYA
jgi:hypothetical protein